MGRSAAEAGVQDTTALLRTMQSQTVVAALSFRTLLLREFAMLRLLSKPIVYFPFHPGSNTAASDSILD